MSWSIAEIARISGVSSRTLRHYHAIGLLTPAWVAANGWRHYEQEHVLRLQQILLLRNLGLGLRAVADILKHDSRDGTVAVLQRHRRWLAEEQERLGRLMHTIDRTIDDLQEGRQMTRTMFEGFERNPYEAEARQRWGDAAVDASYEQMKGWSPDDAAKAASGYGLVYEGLAPLLAADVPCDDDRVQELVGLHYEVTSLFWTPDAETYRALGQGYVDDKRFTAAIGQGNDALVAYLRDAMAAYADAKLT
jgi:DNA-binding transcriptional MerR regulator